MNKGKSVGYLMGAGVIIAFAIREIGKYGAIILPPWLGWIGALDRLLLGFSGHPQGDVFAFVNYMGIFAGLLAIGLLRRPRSPPFTQDLSGVPEDARPRRIECPEQAFAYSRHVINEAPQDHAIVHEIAVAKKSPIETILRYYEEKGAHD